MTSVGDWKRRGTGEVLAVLLVAALMLLAALPAMAAPAFPEVIPLPDGFPPEGIATGRGSTFYVSNIGNGSIYAGDYRTGEGEVLVEATEDGTPAVGLKVDDRTNYLFVASAQYGARVYDAETGDLVGDYPFAPPTGSPYPALINDVVITNDAAYFTDSCSSTIYKLPLGPGGELPQSSAVDQISLTGFPFVFADAGDPEHYPCGLPNMNGIVATENGKWLIVGNMVAAQLYRVNPESGEAVQIQIDGPADAVAWNDGLLLHDKTLYVVQNFLNRIAVLELSQHLSTADFQQPYITSPGFQIPATAAFFGSYIYAVNARFDTPPLPTTAYTVVRVNRNFGAE